MGYRSEVAIVISTTRRGENRNREKIEIPKSVFFRDDIFEQIESLDSAVLFYDSSVKWYQTDADIAAIEAFLHTELDPEDYLFMVIGEDMNDVSIEGCFWDNVFNLRMNRSLDFDGKD